MWRSRLFWQTCGAIAATGVVVLLVVHSLAGAWMRSYAVSQMEERLLGTASLLQQELQPRLADSPSALQARVRRWGEQSGLHVAVIDPEGNVLADSEKEFFSGLTARVDQQEFVAAAEEGYGAQVHPATGSHPERLQVVVALPLAEEQTGFLRVAASLEGVQEQTARLQSLAWWLGLATVLVGLLVAGFVSASYVRPVSEIADAARAVAGGNFESTVGSTGRGEIGKLSAAFANMQERMRARAEVAREENERLHIVVESMQEGLVAVAPDERVLLANEASRTLLGFSTRDVMGRPLREVTRNRSIHDAVTDAFESADPVESEFEVPTNPRRVLSLRAQRLPGQPCPGVVVVLHDVSDLRRLENLRREFVANVSHELKTPLASVKAYAETLRLGAVNDPENNLLFVDRIEEQADRLHQLILDLISLARVESGQQAFDIQAVALPELVDACVAAHREAAEAKQIALTREPAGGEVFAMADEEGLRTIVNNLVDNAIKYTPEGGSVAVRWWRDAAGAHLEVADTGIGIAPDDQQRVFERFYRVDKARSREMGGTGLGLSIVKHLSQAFSGSVDLDSQLDRGSRFTVHLPAGDPLPG